MLADHDEAAVPNTYISFRFHEHVIPDFYNGYFESNSHGKQLTKFITKRFGTNELLGIKPSDFFSIILPTPELKEEQQKIADCLSSLEELIAAEDNKLKALKDHKKGLIQKLIPTEGKALPELRFPEYRSHGEWNKTAFKHVFDSLHIATITSSLKEQAADPSGDGAVDNAGSSVEDEIVIVGTGPNIGKAYMHSVIYDTQHSNRSLIHGSVNKQHHPEFILAQTLTSRYEKWVAKITTHPMQPRIRTIEYESFTFYCPSLLEQKKIADCLSSIDDLIKAQLKKIEHLRVHKRGLLQSLYPSVGEIRG